MSTIKASFAVMENMVWMVNQVYHPLNSNFNVTQIDIHNIMGEQLNILSNQDIIKDGFIVWKEEVVITPSWGIYDDAAMTSNTAQIETHNEDSDSLKSMTDMFANYEQMMDPKIEQIGQTSMACNYLDMWKPEIMIVGTSMINITDDMDSKVWIIQQNMVESAIDINNAFFGMWNEIHGINTDLKNQVGLITRVQVNNQICEATYVNYINQIDQGIIKHAGKIDARMTDVRMTDARAYVANKVTVIKASKAVVQQKSSIVNSITNHVANNETVMQNYVTILNSYKTQIDQGIKNRVKKIDVKVTDDRFDVTNKATVIHTANEVAQQKSSITNIELDKQIQVVNQAIIQDYETTLDNYKSQIDQGIKNCVEGIDIRMTDARFDVTNKATVINAAKVVAQQKSSIANIELDNQIQIVNQDVIQDYETTFDNYRNQIDQGIKDRIRKMDARTNVTNRAIEINAVEAVVQQKGVNKTTPFDFIYSYLDGSKSIASIANNANKAATVAGIASEDLKFLREISEGSTNNRFRTGEIKVDMTNYNTVTNDLDLDEICNKLREKIESEANACAEGVYA